MGFVNKACLDRGPQWQSPALYPSLLDVANLGRRRESSSGGMGGIQGGLPTWATVVLHSEISPPSLSLCNLGGTPVVSVTVMFSSGPLTVDLTHGCVVAAG